MLAAAGNGDNGGNGALEDSRSEAIGIEPGLQHSYGPDHGCLQTQIKGTVHKYRAIELLGLGIEFLKDLHREPGRD